VSPSLGTISSTGLYTAPASLPTEQPVIVTATSVADPTKIGSVTVTLLPGVTGGAGTTDLSLLASSLCRHPHVGPTVSAGGDRDAHISCTGSTCTPISVGVQGAALTYTLVPGFALDYSWSLLSGPAPVQFSSPNSTSSNVTINAPGNYTLQFSVSDGLSTGSAVMHIFSSSYANGNGQVYLTPAVNGPNAVNTPVTLQATWRHSDFGPVVAGGTIIVTVTGANPQTATIVTDGNGNATFTYTGLNPGTDTILAVGQAGNLNGNVPADAVTVTWAGETPKLTSSPVTGQFFPADGSGTFNITPSTTPAFTQVFPGINFDPAAGTVPGNTSGVTNQTRPLTNIVTDRTGNYAGAIVAQGDAYQAGVGSLYNFGAVFTGTLSVPSAGQVTFTITSDDAFIFGIGNAATRISGPQTNTPATTPFKTYAVIGGVNQRSAPTPNTITVNFPAAGAYPYELDYAKGGDNKMTLTMTASGSPIPAPVLLTLTPASAPSITAGQVELLTLTATDTSGVVLTYLPVTVSVTGVNAQTRLLTTNGVGQVDFAYVGEQYLTGNDTVQAAARVNGSDIYSNAVVITWNNGTNAAPVVSAGTPQTVILPAPAILSGSATDDGLPANTLTMTWTKVSGPGTVTFDNANQANTSASFSAAGSYVLQLSATDGTLTTNSTVAISAVNNPNWSSGWLASPLDKAPISVPTPVTLIPGITLISGTLTYWPVNSPQSPVTLNASTTGTGQIATFDPTLLNNGNYFIVLSATNSVGGTMTSQVYVTVIGDYKPGRVTATVTDLKVPATGLPITISRTYDSLTRSSSMDFGYGWKLGIQVQMDVSPTADVTFTVNGQRRTFYFTPPLSILGWYTPLYTAESGFYGTLTTTSDNCSGVLQHIGNVWQCGISNGGAAYQPTAYTYTDAYGRVYTVGSDGNLQSVKDLNNNTLTVTPTGITSSTGLNVPFVRDTQGRITRITDPLGNAYNYAYDANGNLSTLTLPPAPPTVLGPVTYTYDSAHLLTSEKDPRGNTGTTNYYPNGTLQSVTDPAGQTTSYVYNTATNTTAVTNPDGGIATTIADSYGNPLSATDGIGRTTVYAYDANHNKLTEQNPNHETTTYTYDGSGFLTSKKDNLGNTWAYLNNTVGGPTSVTDPNQLITNLAYDSNFNVSTMTDTIGQLAAFTYTAQGLPQTTTDANARTSSLSYDQYGNRTSVQDPMNRTTTNIYDTQGRLTSQTDPRLNKTHWAYDPFGRKTSMTDPSLKITTFGYDANGNKITETDPLHHTTTYTYDGVNRMTGVQYADGTSKTMTYDFRGNQLTEIDQLERMTKWVYDLAGQLTSVT
jgi:YD repeat-containing protein